MYLSYNWLKELTGFKESPEKLAEILNLQVAAVEKVEKLGKGLDKVIVAEILEIKPHPNADKLQLVKVATKQFSNKAIEQFNIVCGAFNIKVGDKVPLALSGVILSNGAKIEETTIRGVKSEGMLCAEDELGVGEDHTGILIFDKAAKTGEQVAKVLGLDDAIIEIENVALSHRPDLFGHLGFAREIGAITGIKRKVQGLKSKVYGSRESFKLKIEIEDSRDCPRYMGVVVDGIKIASSPSWLQNRLRNLGIRPINNVVDITNYVMMEIGQPLHAFDFTQINADDTQTNAESQRKSASSQRQSAIVVRRAKQGEKLLCLDGVERKLDSDILVIADAQKPIALAGIMGGEESGITERTKTIVIESANFNPVTIRKGARKLGLRTEANLRFEKGLPLIFAKQGMLRAIELLEKLAGGKAVSKIYDVKDKKTEKLLKTPRKIILDVPAPGGRGSPNKIGRQKVSDLIGENISEKQIIKYLTSLEFDVKRAGRSGKSLVIGVPLHRFDIEYPEDIIEEIVRLYGYQKIRPWPIQAKLEIYRGDTLITLEKNLKNILVGLGLDEVYNYSFYGENLINLLKLHKEDHLELANPINPDQRYLRITLLPKILENAAKNIPFFDSFKIFECGKVYKEKEEKYLSGLILEKNKNMFFAVKGATETILEKIGIDKNRISFQTGKSSNYQYLKNLTGILVDGKPVAIFGELNETFRNNLKILSEVGLFEINLESLRDLEIGSKIFQKISSYPPIVRDLAFLVPKNIVFKEICETIKNFHSLIYSVEPFDVFESEKLGGNVRNIAFHLIFQSFERTLKSEEIDKIINDLVKILEQKFGAKLRTF